MGAETAPGCTKAPRPLMLLLVTCVSKLVSPDSTAVWPWLGNWSRWFECGHLVECGVSPAAHGLAGRLKLPES